MRFGLNGASLGSSFLPTLHYAEQKVDSSVIIPCSIWFELLPRAAQIFLSFLYNFMSPSKESCITLTLHLLLQQTLLSRTTHR